MNKRIEKSRENTDQGGFGISPVDNITRTRIELEQDPNQHYHDWQYANQWRLSDFTTMLKFVCVCGAYKVVKQFEVEE